MKLMRGVRVPQNHKQRHTRIYGTWCNIHSRCKPEYNQRKDYYDRGIRVCKRWREFDNFYADMGECPAGLTIERIDNDRGYEPSNCRWATRGDQRRNSRRLILLSICGETLCLKDWAAKIGIPYGTVYWHWQKGDVVSYIQRKIQL